MRKITINGEDFQLIKPRKALAPVEGGIDGIHALLGFYSRPSKVKLSIWSAWCYWAMQTEGIEVFEICSANTFQFAIKGLYNDGEHLYNLYITSSSNKAYLVE